MANDCGITREFRGLIVTQSEAEEFFVDVVFVAFPGARRFVLMNSSEPKKTVAVMAKALSQVSFQEAMSVVDRWTRGELPAPVGGELESIALHLRATVMQDRSVRARRGPLEEIRKGESKWRSNVDVAPYYDRILKIAKLFQAGELDLKTCQRMQSEVVAEHQSEYERRQASRKPRIAGEPEVVASTVDACPSYAESW